jgi:hypothetical protein
MRTQTKKPRTAYPLLAENWLRNGKEWGERLRSEELLTTLRAEANPLLLEHKAKMVALTPEDG